VSDRIHDQLLTTFDFMVERQLEFINESQLRSPNTYRRDTKSV
jgi:hypothetical protein